MNLLEIAAAAVIIAILLIILGVGALTVLKLLYSLLALVLGLMAVFFCVCVVLLLTSKKVHGEFVCFDSTKRFETAVYKHNGNEYRNIFPAEKIMRQIIYKSGEHILFIHNSKKYGFVIDMHSVFIVVLGLLLSLLGLALILYQVKTLLY